MTQIPYICFHHVTFFSPSIITGGFARYSSLCWCQQSSRIYKASVQALQFSKSLWKTHLFFLWIYLFILFKKFKFYILAPVTPPFPSPIPNVSHPTSPSLLRGSHPERLISSGLVFISVLVIFCLAAFSILSLFCTLLLLFM